MTAHVSAPNLVLLCHRIPYPPDKGDKIRSYHWLLALSRCFSVHLAAFVDDEEDWEHREVLDDLCASTLLLPLNPARAKLRSLGGLFTGDPLSLPYYRDPALTRWLAELARSTEIRYLVVYSSAMAQYAAGPECSGARRVIDFVDVDSDKWRQYAERMQGPMRWIYRREAERLEAYELDIAHAFDACLFVSPTEATWFRNRMGEGGEHVTHVNNGVDSVYFDPVLPHESPYLDSVKAVVFTGAMDYWANEDAVSWFAHKVWPQIRAQEPRAVFYIVGARPTASVRGLAAADVVVTGRVPDVRPYLRYAAVVVAPMHIARGIQNKVLEGMSMARPVIVTTKALEGIRGEDGLEVLVADDAEVFAARVLEVLSGRASDLGAAARALVRRDYSWEENGQRLVALVQGSDAA